MTDKRLDGKRVLVTQSDDYMGPATIELFRVHDAEVITDSSDLTQPGAVEELVEKTGHIDVLVANLAAPANFGTSAVDMDDQTWEQMFDIMVHPLHRLCRAVLPQMYQRQAGKVVVFGSATGREDALFALFLASNESDFFVGQAIPFSGGWVQ